MSSGAEYELVEKPLLDQLATMKSHHWEPGGPDVLGSRLVSRRPARARAARSAEADQSGARRAAVVGRGRRWIEPPISDYAHVNLTFDPHVLRLLEEEKHRQSKSFEGG